MSVLIAGVCIIIVLGSIGNIISIIIWRYGRRSKNASCGTYMWSLALNDLFLLSFLRTEYVLFESRIHIRSQLEFVCKVVLYSGEVAPQVSAWITAAIAMERMLCVCLPIRMYQSNVQKRSLIVLGLILLCSMTLNITELLLPEKLTVYLSHENDTFTICAVDLEYQKQYWFLSTISYGIFTFLLPLVIISTSNTITLIKVCFRKRSHIQNDSQQRNVRNITKVVVCISVLHCVSTFPYAMFHVRNAIGIDTYLLNNNFVVLSYFFNSAFNFVVYSLLGSDFRQDLKELCHNLREYCRSLRNCHSEERTTQTTRV